MLPTFERKAGDVPRTRRHCRTSKTFPGAHPCVLPAYVHRASQARIERFVVNVMTSHLH